MPESVEFNQIRQTIMNSEFVVNDPEKACLIVPGVDLLNLRKFKSVDEVQRVVETIRLIKFSFPQLKIEFSVLFCLQIPIFYFLILLEFNHFLI